MHPGPQTGVPSGPGQTDPVPASPVPGVSADTLRRVERAAGGLATRSVAVMDDRLPWFRTLPPQERSWVTLVAQAGIAGYVTWAQGSAGARVTDQVFGTAPRDLVRAVSLRRTVELVRVAISVAEEHLPALGATDEETVALRESLVRYSREIAFSAAAVYAAAAETRGAWDARVEAAVVDGIVRGEDVGTLSSRVAALGWDAGADLQVVVGRAPVAPQEEVVAAAAEWAQHHQRASLAGVQGGRLVLILAGSEPAEASVAELFADGPVVAGPVAGGLSGASESAAEALAGLAAVAAWSAAPRPVPADDLLTERVIAGDRRAAERLRSTTYTPLAAAGGALLESLDAYLAHGGSLEPAARSLFVHPNTLRYRLRRVADITGRDPWDPRDLAALHTALIVGRLSTSFGGTEPRP